FDDSNNSGTNFTVAVDAGGITANSILFANGTGTYAINGPGALTVTASVTKQQAGSATLNTKLSVPITTVTAGTLTVGGGASYSSTNKVDVTTAGALAVS